jgi:hypothetical protein
MEQFKHTKIFSKKYFGRRKNHLLRTNLVHVTIGSRIRFWLNWSNDIRFGTSTKGHLISITLTINPSSNFGRNLK